MDPGIVQYLFDLEVKVMACLKEPCIKRFMDKAEITEKMRDLEDKDSDDEVGGGQGDEKQGSSVCIEMDSQFRKKEKKKTKFNFKFKYNVLGINRTNADFINLFKNNNHIFKINKSN